MSGRHDLQHRGNDYSAEPLHSSGVGSFGEAALRAGFPESKLHVHYTGIDRGEAIPFCRGIQRDPKLILFVGRLVEVKGCEYLIRAMALSAAKSMIPRRI